MELATLPLLADIADLADLRGVDPDDEDHQALQALAQASAFFRSYTGKVITVVEDDEQVLTGTWDNLLKLPQRPVISVSAVARRRGSETVDTEDVAPYSLLRDHLYRYGGWGGPEAIVTVTYTHGFEVIPDDVRATVLSMAARAYAGFQATSAGQSGSVVREKIVNYEVQYGETSTSTETSSSGVRADEQSVLDKYRAW